MEEYQFSENLLQRFCKEQNLPIGVFKNPIFKERIESFNSFYETIAKYDVFIRSMKPYNDEQEYFVDYRNIKEKAIDIIKTSDGFNRFNTDDDIAGCSLSSDFTNLPTTSIYSDCYVGRIFLSIDMVKANFNILKNYSPDIFGFAHSWDEFMRRITSNEHVISGKYIRQVILGNCNPKRQIKYQKYIMSKIITSLYEYFDTLHINVLKEHLFAFYNDEIIYDVTDIDGNVLRDILSAIKQFDTKYPILANAFELRSLGGYGYFTTKIKCGEMEFLPMIVRKMQGEEIQQNDLVFQFKGQLAKFQDVPDNIKTLNFEWRET